MIEQIKENLSKLATEQQKKFNEKIIPNALPILGVKIPELRKYAKRICKNEIDIELLLAEYDASSFELQMLYGFVLAYAKMDINIRIHHIKKFLLTIKDWAVCDCFISSLNCISSNLDIFFSFLQNLEESDLEFEIRFIAVVLMEYYLMDFYVDKAIQVIKKLKLSAYYAKMGVAWFIATLMVNYPKKAFSLLDYFEDPILRSMTIRKIRDSYRIPKAIKQESLKYKM